MTEDQLTKLAADAEEVLGSDPILFARPERPGNWAVYGAAIALLATLVVGLPWWSAVLIVFALGWYANEREAGRIRERYCVSSGVGKSERSLG